MKKVILLTWLMDVYREKYNKRIDSKKPLVIKKIHEHV